MHNAITPANRRMVATAPVHNPQARARGHESVLVEIARRSGDLEASIVQHKLEQVSGVSRVLLKQQIDGRGIFEVESQKGKLIRGDLARAVVESGWDLNELRPAAMSLEEIFLQLTKSDVGEGDDGSAEEEVASVKEAQA